MDGSLQLLHRLSRNEMCKDKGAALQWPTLTSERIRTDSVLYRENKRAVATAPGCSGEMGRSSGWGAHCFCSSSSPPCAAAPSIATTSYRCCSRASTHLRRTHSQCSACAEQHRGRTATTATTATLPLPTEATRKQRQRCRCQRKQRATLLPLAHSQCAQRRQQWPSMCTMMARMARQGHDSQCVRCVERCAEQHIEGQRNDGKSGQAGP